MAEDDEEEKEQIKVSATEVSAVPSSYILEKGLSLSPPGSVTARSC